MVWLFGDVPFGDHLLKPADPIVIWPTAHAPRAIGVRVPLQRPEDVREIMVDPLRFVILKIEPLHFGLDAPEIESLMRPAEILIHVRHVLAIAIHGLQSPYFQNGEPFAF